MFETIQSRQVYCGRDCQPYKPRASAKVRGYAVDHVRMRRQWAQFVAAGLAECSLCYEQIVPDQAWHLDHTDDRQGYRGVAHAACNLALGAIKGNRSPLRRRRVSLVA